MLFTFDFKGILMKPYFLLAGALLFDQKIRHRAQQAKIYTLWEQKSTIST
jgi:hypothetical protein